MSMKKCTTIVLSLLVLNGHMGTVQGMMGRAQGTFRANLEYPDPTNSNPTAPTNPFTTAGAPEQTTLSYSGHRNQRVQLEIGGAGDALLDQHSASKKSPSLFQRLKNNRCLRGLWKCTTHPAGTLVIGVVGTFVARAIYDHLTNHASNNASFPPAISYGDDLALDSQSQNQWSQVADEQQHASSWMWVVDNDSN